MRHAGHAYGSKRDTAERFALGDSEFIRHADGEGTGGVFTVFEELPPLLDTSRHVHTNEDEIYYVLEGDHVFECGNDSFTLGPGELVFLPRGVPHAHRRVVRSQGRLLTMLSPAGLEGFFRELAAADRDGRLSEAYGPASERHGITWLS